MSTHVFAEEHDVGFDITSTRFTFGNFTEQHMLLHRIVVEFDLTSYTALLCKTPVSFDDLVCRDSSAALQGIDILRETSVEERLCSE